MKVSTKVDLLRGSGRLVCEEQCWNLAMLNASGASVSVTVEIHADLPAGFPDSTIRVIKENAAQLGFKFSEFS